ncbi:sulfatase-like hydrolase/transferase [Novipirellula artificiosorum]|uniref:Arylsulfatase n=1 Tax=Novipirellula artificiosorum TaxID=2528016 RepID=A0A5C6DTE1_9BACT|nr:sulfatase-like hydrolase/transferase [Novipirellula artificiosorum]TWU40583.1 Arylsulfatase [Novipirellula artificiosorum]
MSFNAQHALPLILLAILVSSVAETRAQPSPSRPSKPNIIIMMADDMGIGDTSAYLGVRLSPSAPPNERTLRTPNLERFAQSGILFTDGYAPASMCSATRYSLLTGRFAHRSYLKYQGWLPHGPNTPMIQQALTTLPEMLQANGYRTAGIGKYHVGMSFDDGAGKPADDFYFHDVDFTKPLLDGPTHHGFDEYFGVPGNTEDPLDTEPRVLIRNDRFAFTDRKRMKLIGMKEREGRILASPEWDLKQLGPLYLREAESFIDRQSKRPDEPFFLYYVPNANHFQRNPDGDYAVPDEIAGTPIRGQSQYSDAAKAADREDMVLENDVVLGKLLEKLMTTNDPRWPGHKLIENTLVIFTSDNGPNIGDNLGRNQESGGLRGKKAKLWEGGIRVPFLVSWPAVLEGGILNRSIVTLTDLYATLARIVGHSLAPDEAQDSHDVFAYWKDAPDALDTRPRVFFCHLGPPYLSDALAIRKGTHKLIVNGGLAMPWAPWSADGSRGDSLPTVVYDLKHDLYEDADTLDGPPSDIAHHLADELLEIHNRGYAGDLNLPSGPHLIIHPGWHNLRNDVTGEIGFEFQLRTGGGDKLVTHLGMFDDYDKDTSVRPARSVPTEHQRDQPSTPPAKNKKRQMAAKHTLSLLRVESDGPIEIVRCQVSSGDTGELQGSFRCIPLQEPVRLRHESTYILLMSTKVADGDRFHDPVSFDGLSPLVHPDVVVRRSILVRNEDIDDRGGLPAFEDVHDSYSKYRMPVGPTLLFQQ